MALPKRGGQIIDQRGGGGEVGIEAVLNGAIGDGHRQVRLSAAGFARENQRAALGDEVRRERRAEHGQSQGGLIEKVEIIDGLEKRKVRPPRQAREAGLAADGQSPRRRAAWKPASPRLLLGAPHEVAPHAAGVGEVEPFEEGVEIVDRRDYDRPPTRREDTAVLDCVQGRRGASPWTRPARGRGGAAIVGGRSGGANGSAGRVASR